MRWRLVIAGAALTMAGCVPPNTVNVTTDGPLPRVETRRAVVGAGERVLLVVHDSIWGHRYSAGATLKDGAETPLLLVRGAAGLSRFAAGIPLLMQAAGTRRAPFHAPQEALQRRGILSMEVRARIAPPALADSVAAYASAQRDELDALIEGVETANEETARAAAAVARELDSLRDHMALHPGDAAVLSFMMNTRAHRLAASLADDSLPALTTRALLDLTDNQRARLTPDSLDRLVQDARTFARTLDALFVFTPAAAGAAVDPALATRLEGLKEAFNGWVEATGLRDRLHAQATALAVSRGRTSDVPAPAGDLPPLGLLGDDIRPLLERTGDFRLLDVRHDLLTLAGNIERLAAALSRLPEWTRGPREQVVLDRAFAGPKELEIKVVRSPRYGTFAVVDGQSPPNAGATAGTGGKAGAPGRLSEAQDETVAVVRMQVLPKHRLHLTAGALWSQLRTTTYATTEDSAKTGVYVRETGYSRSRLVPAAMLSYIVFPAGGKFEAAEAQSQLSWPERAGLGLQLGVSLVHPTEEQFVGISSEPVPGLTLGVGWHRAYLETSTRPSGAFVPYAEGAAVEKRWHERFGAVTVGIDADVFVSTLAGIFK